MIPLTWSVHTLSELLILLLQATTDPSPLSWTLRFKSGRQTILLFVDPLESFKNIKTSLLTVLHERYSDGLPDPSSSQSAGLVDSARRIAIPQIKDTEDLELGLPNEEADFEKGWKILDNEGGQPVLDSPKLLGLKDGSVIAFRFRGQDDFKVKLPSYEDAYPDMEQQEEDDEI